MKSKPAAPTTPGVTRTAHAAGDAERDQIGQNIEAVLAFYAREEEKMSASQRVLERVSDFIGRPIFLALILLIAALWITVNLAMHEAGMLEFDPAPFFWLQGIIGLGSLLTATAVLIRQNRLGKLAEQREHLDLKVTLLTEQKVAKLIDLIEELRRDMPSVRNRDDPEAAALKQSLNPEQVLAALDERSEVEKGAKTADDAKADAGSGN